MQMAAGCARILWADRDFHHFADRNRAPRSNDREKQPGILRDSVERAKQIALTPTFHSTFEGRPMYAHELIGFAAALAVLVSFSMSSIISLRSVAILSNVLFISYGALGHLHPVLFLHAALLPINLIKLYRAMLPRRCSFRTSEHETPALNNTPVQALSSRTP